MPPPWVANMSSRRLYASHGSGVCLAALVYAVVVGACGSSATPPRNEKGDAALTPDASNDAGMVDVVVATDGTAATVPCPPGNLECHPLAPLPASIDQTGITGVGSSVISPRRHFYVPSPELYSNGLTKERHMLLPPGTVVDNANRGAWQYPIGTLFVKTFFDEGTGGKPRPVETRFIRRVPERFEPWEYAVYRWNTDGTRAERLDIAGNKRGSAMVTVAGKSFEHVIPSRNDCGECHEKNAEVASVIIGFDEIRLNHRRAADAPSELEAVATRNLFAVPPPSPAATIAEPDARLLQVKRFVFGNCVHCHNGKMNIVDLRPEVFVANVIGKVPEAPGIAPMPGYFRVVPGDPEKSVAYLQARGTNLPTGLRPMPQVGVQVRDLPPFSTELATLRAWIESLPKNP